MRCYICDFNEDERGPTNNHVFEHKGQPICQACFDEVLSTLLEYDLEEESECSCCERTVPKL